jgi:hypothetical protein
VLERHVIEPPCPSASQPEWTGRRMSAQAILRRRDDFDIWLVVLCVFGLLVALGATSGVVDEQLWVSEPLTCALAGIAIGPVGTTTSFPCPAAIAVTMNVDPAWDVEGMLLIGVYLLLGLVFFYVA